MHIKRLYLFIIIFLIGLSIGQLVTPHYNDPSPNLSSPTMTIDGNLDTLCLLEEYAWSMLSVEERLAVCSTIAAVECSHLGLPYELTIKLVDGPTSCIPTEKDFVTLDLELLTGKGEYVLKALLHKVFHKYEMALIAVWENTEPQNLLIFSDAREYSSELQLSPKEWPYSLMELHALEYAEIRESSYYEKIYTYLFKLSRP